MTTPVIAPLQRYDSGGRVIDLHAALKQALSGQWDVSLLEADGEQYGGQTSAAVLRYRSLLQLGSGADVDAATAASLNSLICATGTAPWTLSVVVARHDGKALAAPLVVHVLNQIGEANTLLVAGRTDGGGRLTLTYAPAKDLQPRLWLRVLDDTGRVVAESRNLHPSLWPGIKVELGTRRYRVQGSVRNSAKDPQAGLLVEALDKDLRRSNLLHDLLPGAGSAWVVTDADGSFDISYDTSLFAPADGWPITPAGQLADRPEGWIPAVSPDLYLRVRQMVGNDTVVVLQTDVRLEAGEVETWPLQISDAEGGSSATDSEFIVIALAVWPMLSNQLVSTEPDGFSDLAPRELADADLTFIQRDTGVSLEKLRSWAAAYAVVAALGLKEQNINERDAAAMAFYAWFRLDLVNTLQGVFERRGNDALVDLLGDAIGKNIVWDFRKQTHDGDPPVSQWDWIKSQLPVWRSSQVGGGGTQAPAGTVGAVLAAVGFNWLGDVAKTSSVLELIARTDVENDSFIEGASEILGAGDAALLRRTVRLGNLTQLHGPLVASLHSGANGRLDWNADDTASVEPIAKLERDTWLDLALEHDVPAGYPASAEDYGLLLAEQAEEKVPHAALLANGTLTTKLAAHPGYVGVLDLLKARKFDIAAANLDAIEGTEALPSDLAPAVRRLQQLNTLGARWEHVSHLIETGLDHVGLITEYSRDQFEARIAMRMDAQSIERIYGNAQAMKAASVGLMGYLQPMLNGVASAVQTSLKDVPGALQQIEGSPTLRKLFGNIDGCACDPCISVLSPPAYLADLLKFIDASGHAGQVLRARRSDIYDLDLSCDNASIELPHIDLAVEVMESAIAFPRDVDTGGANSISDALKNPDFIRDQVLRELRKTCLEDDLGAVNVTADTNPIQPLGLPVDRSVWVASAQHRRWVLEAHDGFIGVVNSAGDSTHLAAPPAYKDRLNEMVSDLMAHRGEGVAPFQRVLVDAAPPGMKVADGYLKYSVSSYDIVIAAPDALGNPVWTVNYILSGTIGLKVDNALAANERQILEFADAAESVKSERDYSSEAVAATYSSLSENRLGGVTRNLGYKIDDAKLLLVPKANQPGWYFEFHFSVSAVLQLRPASLRIVGMGYQSVDAGRDHFLKPDNRNPLTDEALAAAVYPWTLPYSEPLAEVGADLEKAGLHRRDLLLSVKRDADRYFDLSLAFARLRLYKREARLISGAPVEDTDFWLAWGLVAIGNGATWQAYDPDADVTRTAKPLALLRRISVLLRQSRLAYDELRQLVWCRFVNPNRSISIVPIDEASGSTCDLTAMSLQGDDEEVRFFLERLHRFVRLWRVLRWPIADVDRALMASGGTRQIDNSLLVQVSLFAELKERLGLTVEVLTSAFAGFSDWVYHVPVGKQLEPERSHYDRLFQDPVLGDKLDADLAYAKAKTDTSTRIVAKAESIGAALRIRASDVVALVVEPDAGALSPLTERLAKLYRQVVLLQAMRMTLPEYRAATVDLALPAPSDAASTLSLLDELLRIRSHSTDFVTLAYALTPPPAAPATSESKMALASAQASSLLTALRAKLRAVPPPTPAAASSILGVTPAVLGAPPFVDPVVDDSYWTGVWGLVKDQQGNWSDSASQVSDVNPLTVLRHVKVLFAQLSLPNVAELFTILQTAWVSEGVAIAPAASGVFATEIGTATLNDADFWHCLLRLRRFAALSGLTRLTVIELDSLLRALPLSLPLAKSTAIDWVDNASTLLTLRDGLAVPLDELAPCRPGVLGGQVYRKYALRANDPTAVDATTLPDVFERWFGVGKAGLKMTAGAKRRTLDALPNSFDEVIGAIGRVFGATAVDMSSLLRQKGIAGSLDMAKLDSIYRWLRLSVATKTSVVELLRAAAPLGTADLDGTVPVSGLQALSQQTQDELPRARLVSNELATALNVDPALMSDLLWDFLQVQLQNGQAAQPAIESFLTDGFVYDDAHDLSPTGVLLQPEGQILVRLYKLALLNTSWKFTRGEWQWLKREAVTPRFLVLDPDKVPSATGEPAVLYDVWKQTTALVDVAHAPPETAALVDAFLNELRTKTAGRAASFAGAYGQLHSEPNSSAAVDAANTALIEFCAGKAAPDGTANLDGAPWTSPVYLSHVLRLARLAQRIGVRQPADIDTLLADEPGSQAAGIARQILRARFTEAGWPDAQRSVSAQLREARRDRLIDFLLQRDRIVDAGSLYQRYLIDVEMGSCMNTTRLLQATASAQLFVNRCLLGLERSAVSPGEVSSERWQWMQNYRVWEANRKVFLYPENWLFPELRDDRTDTFRLFETAMTQSEPSHQNTVVALGRYLDDLVEVSQVRVVGMYDHAQFLKDTQSSSTARLRRTLYLVGRSPNPPYVYFWRKATHYAEPSMQWSGWERIDQDIPSDHVVPFVFEGDLHMAWPSIKEITDDKGLTIKYDLGLSWTRKVASSWTKRKNALTLLQGVPAISNRSPLANLSLRVDYEYGLDQPRILCFYARNRPLVESLNETSFSFSKIRKTESEIASTVMLTVTASIASGGVTQALSSSKYSTTAIGAHVVKMKARENTNPTKPPSGTFDQWQTAVDTRQVLDDIPKIIHLVGGTEFSIECSSPQAVQGGSTSQKCEFPDQYGMDYRAHVNVVFASAAPIISDEQTALPMFRGGAFLFQPGMDVEVQPTYDPGIELPIPLGCRSVANAFVEATGRKTAGLTGVTAKSTTERFTALLAARNSKLTTATWYLQEGNNRFLVGQPAGSEADAPTIYPMQFQGVASSLVSDNANGYAETFRLENQKQVNNGFISDYLSVLAENDPVSWKDPGFDSRFGFAPYNWEVFYHLPHAAARYLSRQKRFQDARQWFHLVFDPTTNDKETGAERYWRVQPFRTAQSPTTIANLLTALSDPGADKTAVKLQLGAWLEDPFNPYAIARFRPGAFEWSTVLGYVDNLVDWGDQLFRRDTRESINEATLLYVLASQILGPRPRRIATGDALPAMSYRTLAAEGTFDDLSNVWLTLANSPLFKAWESFLRWLAEHGFVSPTAANPSEQLASVGWSYFCVPPNHELIARWDSVENRLFNIRHCRNLDGVTRSLALLDAPIDPAMLVRARAAGLDLGDVLADRFAPMPFYRFQSLLQKANEFCSEVKGLGAALLSAIEKKEAEHLSLLRSTQEITMLRLVESIKREQIDEAKANIEALQKTRSNTLDRFKFLQRQLGKTDISLDSAAAPIVEQAFISQVAASGAAEDFAALALSAPEIDQTVKMQAAQDFATASAILRVASGVAYAVGSFVPVAPAANCIGHSLSAVGDALGIASSINSYLDRRSGLIATWQRRRDDWVQQSHVAAEEIRQIDKQLAAMEIRQSITEKERDNHLQQIENSSDVDDYLRHAKFSGESLYAWMEGQLASVYFSAYQLAYDMAKRAERTYQFELGVETTSFVRFAQWNSLKRGLLSGEQLSQDLRRLESTYLERNRRELEITKHISLRQLNGDALLSLRAEGECEFDLPEEWFDLDFPGHYFRRIKSVSLSIPCVAGPYTSVSATLTIVSSKLRNKASVQGTYADPENLQGNYLSVQSIATSSGQNDSGLFELNFRDERYLPFEGAGAISRWRLTLPSKLPSKFRAFDYKTISDAVLHMRYTARDGGEELAAIVRESLRNRLNTMIGGPASTGLAEIVSVQQDFPREWQVFRQGTQTGDAAATSVSLSLDETHFPYVFRSRVTVKEAVFAWLTDDDSQTLKYSSPAKLQVDPRADSPGTLPAVLLSSENVTGKITDLHLVLHYTLN